MKLNGQRVDSPPVETVVLPRRGGDLVITATPVLDFSDCEKYNPMPEVPRVTKPGETASLPNPDDPRYREKLNDWAQRQTDWQIIQALTADDTLEFETVVAGDPETWQNYMTELKQSFNQSEINAIIGIAHIVCGLSSDMIHKATESFLAAQGSQPKE